VGITVGLLIILFPVSGNADDMKTRAPARVVLGWMEYARVESMNMRFKAKLDTGADNSSINVARIEEFTRDGKPWVRFVIVNEENKEVELEKEVVRTALIRRHGGESQPRYVVQMKITLGGLSKEVEVNLADRSEFTIPLLIGRSFLAPEILVDSGRAYTVN
jgi:hypothetical protein